MKRAALAAAVLALTACKRDPRHAADAPVRPTPPAPAPPLQPISLVGARLEVLLPKVARGEALALDHDSVYWVTGWADDPGHIMKLAKRGGEPVALTEDDPLQSSVLAVGSGVVVSMTRKGQIFSVPIGGGPRKPLYLATLDKDGFEPSRPLVLDGGELVFADGSELHRLRLADGTDRRFPIADGADWLETLTSQGGDMYWAPKWDFHPRLWRLIRGGSPAAIVEVGSRPHGLMVDGDQLYWREIGEGWYYDLWRLPRVGNTPVHVAVDVSDKIAVRAGLVYFARRNATTNQVEVLEAGSGHETRIAVVYSDPDALAIDESGLYLLVTGLDDTQLLRIAR